jgi:arylsulfatase A-like enzyme
VTYARKASRALAAALLFVPVVAFARCGRGDAPARPTSVRYAADGTPSRPVARRANAPNVLLVCLDTLRADALAPWGGAAATLPRTSRFLESGVTFRQAAAAASWTAPSVASLVTGVLPSRHGARDLAPETALPAALPTLAEVLHRAGWHRAAYTGGAWVSAENGMLQGFELARAPFSFGAGAPTLLGRMEEVQAAGRPWFVFAHTYEAHDPYDAPPASPGGVRPPPPEDLDVAALDRDTSLAGDRELVRRFLADPAARAFLFESRAGLARMPRVLRYLERGWREDPEGPALAREARAAYDRGARKLDAALADFLEACEARGFFANAVVVLCSDHGEAFGEGGRLHHGRTLHDALIRVPLWIRAPGWPQGKTIEASVSLLDVLPTVLDLCGLPVPDDSDGRSLAPLVLGAGTGAPAVAEERRSERETGFPVDEDLVCVRDERWKWVRVRDRRTSATREEAFDLVADPSESSPLPGADRPEWSPAFRTAVHATRARQ